MPQKKMATLRYFGRFKGEFGYLRAVVRYDKTRKFIITPLVITKDQLSRLDTTGGIKEAESNADKILHCNLKRYTQYVWHVVKPLLTSGEFDTIPSERLSTAIINYKKAEEAAAQRRCEERAAEEFQRQSEFAKTRGHEIHSISPREFADLNKKLQETLTPEEYAQLWEMPQWKKDYIEERRNEALRAEEGENDE